MEMVAKSGTNGAFSRFSPDTNCQPVGKGVRICWLLFVAKGLKAEEIKASDQTTRRNYSDRKNAHTYVA